MAAPTFELYDFGLEDPVTELNRLAAQVCARAPELDPAAKVLATL